jgi:hypothetical protein
MRVYLFRRRIVFSVWVFLEPNSHVMVTIHTAWIEYLRGQFHTSKDCFAFMRLVFFCGLKGICFPSFERRVWNIIRVTKILHGEWIFGDDFFALA